MTGPTELAARFESASRGRDVRVRSGSNQIFSKDLSVRYDEPSDAYVVEFTDAGCFEEAFRYLERWIARHAAVRDGTYEAPPADHVDCTQEAAYWMLERQADQMFADLQSAVERYCHYLENETYYVPRTGDVVIETRTAFLRGLLAHYDSVRGDVRRAVLSPHSLEVLQGAGLLPATGADKPRA